MNDAQQALFDYLLENQLQNFLPPGYHTRYVRITGLREEALSKTLTDRQKDLFTAYQNAQFQQALLDLQALFRATWAMAHELLCP